MSFECVVGDWHRKKDPGTGGYYYANARTLQSSWTVPPEWEEPPLPAGKVGARLTVENSWTEVTDATTGRLYYVNTMTMESSWEKPPNFKDPRASQVTVGQVFPHHDPDTSDDETRSPSPSTTSTSTSRNGSLENNDNNNGHDDVNFSNIRAEIKQEDNQQKQHQQLSPSLSEQPLQLPEQQKHLHQSQQQQQQHQHQLRLHEHQRSQSQQHSHHQPHLHDHQRSQSQHHPHHGSLSGIKTSNTTATLERSSSFHTRVYTEVLTPSLEQALVLAKMQWTDAQRQAAHPARISALKALIQDEFAYFLDLQVIAVEFESFLNTQRQLGNETLSPGEIKVVIKNIPDLHVAHIVFAQHVASLKTDTQLLSPFFVAILDQLFSSLDLYAHYISSHKNIKNIFSFVERLEGERPGLRATLEHIRSDKCMSGKQQTFEHYLDTPSDRPSRYGPLVFNVLKTIDPSTDDFKAWYDLLLKAETTAHRIEQNAEFITMRDKVADIQRRLHFPNPNESGLKLVTPTRYLVHSGEIKKKLVKARLGSQYKTYMFYVFNDMAMYTSVPDKLKRIVPKRCMPMVGMKAESDEKDVNFHIDSMVKNVQFKAATKDERDQWVRILQECVRRCNGDQEQPRRRNQFLIAPVRGW